MSLLSEFRVPGAPPTGLWGWGKQGIDERSLPGKAGRNGLRDRAGGCMGKPGHGWEIYNASLPEQLLNYQAT